MFVCVKSPATETELTASWTAPSFVRVIVCGPDDVFTFCVGKLSDDGDTVPCAASPVPLKATGVGAVPVLVFMGTLRVPVRIPGNVGTKLTCTEQLCPAGIPTPQEFVCAKLPATLKPVIRKQPCPVLASTSGSGALPFPTTVSGNARAVDERLADPGAAGWDSYTPRSITKLHWPESSPSRAAPEMSCAGKLGFVMSPVSMAGDPGCKWKSFWEAFTNSGSTEMFPFVPAAFAQPPAKPAAPGLNASLE